MTSTATAEDLTDHYAELAAQAEASALPPALVAALPEPTDDELREIWANAARHSAAQAATSAASAKGHWEKGLEAVGGAVVTALRAEGVAPPIPAATVFRCDGGCSSVVRSRGDWCSVCARESRYVAYDIALADARRSVNPEGCRDWCRPGEDAYQRAMSGTKAQPGIKLMYWDLPAADKSIDEGKMFFQRAEWPGASLMLLGPTGIGKSVLMSAICNELLRKAREGMLSPDEFRMASGMRWVSAVDLTNAPKQHKLGDGEPSLIKMAKKAPLLIIDELGKVDNDPNLIMEVLRARYEPRWRPTFIASELPLAELERRYGASTMRGVWQRGRLLDFFPRSAGSAATPQPR